MKIKNTSTAFTLTGLHYLKQRKIIIIIGAVLLAGGFFAAITIGSIVINDITNNKMTPEGYPEIQFLGISAYSYEYASVFTAILGVFVLFGGLVGMDSKKKK
jgi:hypothetical protein